MKTIKNDAIKTILITITVGVSMATSCLHGQTSIERNFDAIGDNLGRLLEPHLGRTRHTLETVESLLKPADGTVSSILGDGYFLTKLQDREQLPDGKGTIATQSSKRWSFGFQSESGISFDTNPQQLKHATQDWHWDETLGAKFGYTVTDKLTFKIGGNAVWSRYDQLTQLDGDVLAANASLVYNPDKTTELTLADSSAWYFSSGYQNKLFYEDQLGLSFAKGIHPAGNEHYEAKGVIGYNRIWSDLSSRDRGNAALGGELSYSMAKDRKKATKNLIFGVSATEKFVHYDNSREYWQTEGGAYVTWQFCSNAAVKFAALYSNRDDSDSIHDFNRLMLTPTLNLTVSW